MLGKIGRAIGFGFLGIVILIVVAAGGVWVNAQRVMGERFVSTMPAVTVAKTTAQVERGRYMVGVVPGCAGCHASNPAANPPLLDGNLVVDLKPLGDFYAPNLTPGGALKGWTDGEVIRAIREGIDKEGRPLLIMPSGEYRHLSDEDVQSIVAYLRSQPAVSNDTPLPRLSPLGTMLMGTGKVRPSNQPPTGAVTAPSRGPTKEYGKYLVETSGCTACHGPELDGKNIPPGPPPGPNLRVTKSWTTAQFADTLRKGVDPAGHQLADTMPWRQFGQATDDDLSALYAYLTSLQ